MGFSKFDIVDKVSYNIRISKQRKQTKHYSLCKNDREYTGAKETKQSREKRDEACCKLARTTNVQIGLWDHVHEYNDNSVKDNFTWL